MNFWHLSSKLFGLSIKIHKPNHIWSHELTEDKTFDCHLNPHCISMHTKQDSTEQNKTNYYKFSEYLLLLPNRVRGWNPGVWPFEQYFNVVLFIMLYKVVPTFKSVDETLVCDHSNESYWAALSCGTVHYAVQGNRMCDHSIKAIEFWALRLWRCKSINPVSYLY